jgi:hypothetical protein
MPLNNRQNGFVILYAVIITTVVLITGVSLMNIITKQLVISSIGRSSKQAYYAALRGKECAEFWKNAGLFGRVKDHTYEASPIDKSLFGCPTPISDPLSETRLVSGLDGRLLSPISGDDRFVQFEINDAENRLCSQVKVRISPSACESQQILIDSSGYNVPCSEINDPVNPRRVWAVYNDRIVSCP